jgi:S-formylglutathione hydrolase
MEPEDAGSAVPSTDEEAGAALTDEGRREIVDRVVRLETRELRTKVVRRSDFEVVLERTAPIAHNREHLIFTLLLSALAGAYFAAGQWPSNSPAFEAMMLALPVGYALMWLYLMVTGGNELETISVDEEGHIQRVWSGPRFEKRDNVLRVAIPMLVIAVSVAFAVVLIHDLIFQPRPNCPGAVFATDPCFSIGGALDGSTMNGFTLGEFRGIVEILRMLALIVAMLCLLPSLYFLRRMLTGHRVMFVRPINRRRFDDAAPALFPGWDGRLYTGIVAALAIVLVGMLAWPFFPHPPSTAGNAYSGPASTLVPFPATSPGSTICQHGVSGFTYETVDCQLESPSLAANLLDEPGILHFSVLTPLDYDTSGVRYPTLYYLMGGAIDAVPSARFAREVALLQSSSSLPEGSRLPIVVTVSGGSATFMGHMYANSPVSGNWEDAITKELISYVDANFRTIASPASRGIAGMSLGGSGAINIALHHPEVFRVLYAMSPSIFEGNAVGTNIDPQTVAAAEQLAEQLANVRAEDRASRLKEAIWASDGLLNFICAYGMAFAPDPGSPILMKLPTDDATVALYNAGFGNIADKVDQYRASLEQYRGIVVDHNTDEGFIPSAAHMFVTLLNDDGIKATEYTYPGMHMDDLDDRVQNYMLPFLVSHLAYG